MNELVLVQKAMYCEIRTCRTTPIISRILYLMFLKMDEEPASAVLVRLRHKSALSRMAGRRRDGAIAVRSKIVD